MMLRTLLAVGWLAGCAGGGVDEPDASDSGAGDSGSGDSGAGDSGAGDSGAGDSGAGDAVDPLLLAGEVSEAELEATITALSAIPTRYTTTDGDEAARDYLVDRLEALGLQASTQMFDADGTEAWNVVAIQDGVGDDGAEWPIVYVFQAHYDSTSTDPLHDAPGADDNASGVAAVLEAARILTAYDLRHTAMYVFTAAEEQGSLGSATLADALAAAGTDVGGVMAPDMMGYWPLGDDDAFDILGDDDSAALVERMAGLADELGVANKPWVNHGFCYGDDHTMWQERGFPAISPMDCVEAHNLGRTGESTPHYHQVTDTIDTLHLPFTAKVTGVTVAMMAEWTVPSTREE